jgi:hypothetical protein
MIQPINPEPLHTMAGTGEEAKADSFASSHLTLHGRAWASDAPHLEYAGESSWQTNAWKRDEPKG